MFNPSQVIGIVCIYMGILFYIAVFVEKKAAHGLNIASNPIIYSLSLAIYCTAWTFYGSVGSAATKGMLFVTVYIGPTLMIIFWWVTLRKLVRIKMHFRITSIADFISARYNKSKTVAAIVTIFLLIGIAPYIALQLKSIFSTFELISGIDSSAVVSNAFPSRLVIVLLLIFFTILFGVRRIDPTERHQGVVTAVAVESIVKLIAFLAVGIYVVYFLYNGIGDIFEQVGYNPNVNAVLQTNKPPYVLWTTYLILSMSAIVFLPRQFHVSVIENFKERHILTAMWLFPVYLFLINIFVYPIAIAGLLKGLPSNVADTFVLRLPLGEGNMWLALLVFIGGFSAATSMVIVCAMALATMFTNHLLVPFAVRVKGFAFLGKYLLYCRWIVVAGCILFAYSLAVHIGKSQLLVSIGMISFAAVFQLVPSIIGGIFWSRGNRQGAILGLTGGFVVWLYTLLLPAIIKSGWLADTILTEGPLPHMKFLRPEHLFGMDAVDPLAHGVFWSITVNVILYVTGALYFEQSQEEQGIAEKFINILQENTSLQIASSHDASISLSDKIGFISNMLEPLFHSSVGAIVTTCLKKLKLHGKTHISVIELIELVNEIEKILAGTIGAASAKLVIDSSMLIAPEEKKQLSNVFSEIIANLKLSPSDLKRKIDYYKERENLLTNQAKELEDIVNMRTVELTKSNEELNTAHKETAAMLTQLQDAHDKLKELDKMKTDFLSTVSHELRTPLTSVLGFAKIVKKRLEDVVFPEISVDNKKGLKAKKQISENIDIIVTEGQRLTSLINDVLDIAKMESGKIEWKYVSVSIAEIIAHAVAATASLFADNKDVQLINDIEDGLPEIMGDNEKLIQVLINLISNAVKFTDKGFITCRAMRKGYNIQVSISDTGLGISRENHTKVFEKFKQVGDTLTNKPKGTGLGLPICKQIVEHHGGKIWLESEHGKGSTFYFTLPFVAQSAGAKTVRMDANTLVRRLKEHVSVSVPSDGRNSKNVLIVDDDIHIRRLLKQQLIEGGYNVWEADNGLEAIKEVKRQRPDLIVLDVMMPEMNGFDVAAVFKNDPMTMTIPIVIFSVVEDKDRGYRLGVDRYFTKSVDMEVLVREVGLLLAHGTDHKKVMVVDDNIGDNIGLISILEERGFNIVDKCNGEECITRAKVLVPDMIIFNVKNNNSETIVNQLRFERGLDKVTFILLDGAKI
ncbi:MAG: ATP-binding protein [Candidatus Magnetoovum sp. WYHC-5]|nr:ATP-binding protein [Candidatus Magnetoovum sp. WYHC-5]